jgi:hypothetical protein
MCEATPEYETASIHETAPLHEKAAALSTPAAAGRAEWRVCRNMTLILTPRQPYVD